MNEIESILTQMTLEEKAALCTGATNWTTTPIERLGLPEMFVADGPHGVRRERQEEGLPGSIPATSFPTASCTASTWNVALLREMGQALGEECIAQKVDVLLGPGVNIKRTPLCGRNFEYFSEDPFLAGELAAAWIEGIQSLGVGVSLKHFAANNQEYQRLTISSEMDGRTLREIYLPAFEKAVKQAKPWTVMCAYNKLNGVFCSENRYLLTDILKEEWGFEGPVVSDWGAVHDRVAAMQGGLDLEMPGPRPLRVRSVVEAVRKGDLDESVLDEAVRRILRVVLRAAKTPKGKPFDAQAHHALARKIAAEGMVLLKNDGILPLKPMQKIAVIGRAAENAHFEGGGSSHVNPTQVDSPLEALKELAGKAELTYAPGYPLDDSFQQPLIEEAAALAMTAEAALLYIALPEYKECEGYDRPDMDLTLQQVELIKAVAAVQPRTVVILNNGSPVVMGEWIDHVAAVLEAWMMGQAGGGAIADILFGKVNPSGKLAETFPAKLSDTPAHINFPGENGQVRYGEGLYIGYRYYDAREMPVLFPFGYGLSYTTFAYRNIKVSADTFRDVDGLTVSVEVTNTGKLPGMETVQVYVHDHQSSLARPVKELKGFAKVDLQAGETKTVEIKLDFRAFAFYHPGYKNWITEDGEFDILVGASSADIRCAKVVSLQSTLALPSLLHKQSTVREWLEDPRGKKVFEALFQEIAGHVAREFAGDDGGEMIGMDVLEMVKDMPLMSVLYHQVEALPASPEEIITGLLAQIK